MKITWIEHSSFLLELPQRVLVLHYFGKTRLPLPANKPVTFLASHHHADHYDKAILEHGTDQIWYVLSRDIFGPQDEHHIKVKPHQRYELNGMIIETLKSNDEGVAFMIEVDGWRILHAGDLNDWHWEEENDQDRQENEVLKRRFDRELERVAGRTFDLAMIPTDPRLNDGYNRGLLGWAKACQLGWIAPMHTFGENGVIDRLLQDPACAELRSRILDLRKGPQVLEDPQR